VVTYLRNVWSGFWTTLVGMSITARYLFRRPVTVQYPDEKLPISDRYRGIHYLEQDKCIYCFQCARACPVDCISMDATRVGKELEWKSFTIDYNKCIFCELCVYPCPADCIHMGKEFAFVVYDRRELVLDLLSWKGLSAAAKERHAKAEEEKKQKAAAAAAAKAAAAKAAPATPPSGGAPAPPATPPAAPPAKEPEPPTG
jgi:NADH-quinone oxidoreductase subunit I